MKIHSLAAVSFTPVIISLMLAACSRDSSEQDAQATDGTKDTNPMRAEEFHCDQPIPIRGSPESPALGLIILFEEGVDAVAEVDRLSKKFTIDFLGTSGAPGSFEGFYGIVPEKNIMRLQCEPSVDFIAYNEIVSIA